MTLPVWPWLLDPAPQGYASSRLSSAQAALANAGVALSRAQIELFEFALLDWIPSQPSDCDWFVVSGRAYLIYRSRDYTVQLAQGLGYGPDGRLVLYGDAMELRAPWRGLGMGLKFKKRQLVAAERLGVSRIHVEANIDVGSYTWAAMGARPDRPMDVRNLLSGRIRTMVGSMIWQPWQAQIVETALANDQSLDFMLNLAQLRAAGRRLGKELLLGTNTPPGPLSWAAHWDLTDADQRTAVIKALG